MKLSKQVLLEIVALIQDGIINDRDISENMRQLDLVPASGNVPAPGDELILTQEYLLAHPRASDWSGPGAN